MDMWRFGARASFTAQESVNERGELQIQFLGDKRYTGPVLLLAGSCNVLIGEDHQREHLSHFPEGKLVVIEGAGHSMFGEKPEESNALVREFLRKANAAPAE
jgi:pimeloyl-ACP methyl ester carboxylesterase